MKNILPNQSPTESRLKSSILLRMFIVAGLTLVLLIPTIFVDVLVSERSSRWTSSILEVSQGWGGTQTLTGPVISIPYKEFAKDAKGVDYYSIHLAHFLPGSLVVNGTIKPEIRYRGLYEMALYSGQFVIEGQFKTPDFTRLHIDPANVLWDEAFISFGITDLKGVRDTINLRWNDQLYPSEPGILSNDVMSAGLTFKPRIENIKGSYTFSIPLSLNGSSEIRFVPVGEVTQVVLDAAWGNPSFVGSFLPHSRDIDASRFHAEWKILNLNRNFPQSWTGNKYTISESSFGASLYLPVDEYQKTSRSVKYAILFIALTFIAFFLSEIITKTAFHPIQYILVGMALVLFYVLLLSLSEHLGFNIAYGIAALGTIATITVYAYWISTKKRIAVVILFVLIALYTFLFVTLQLQDYALLLGSIGLFIVLFVVMYLTRKIDWFTINKTETEYSETATGKLDR